MPRIRTEEKRRDIIEAATKVFERKGYEATTIEEIASKMKASKATIYGYFPSKAALLGAVVTEGAGVDQLRRRYLDLLDRPGALEDVLRNYAKAFLLDVLSPAEIRRRRLLIEAARKHDFGRAIFESGPREAWVRLTAFMARRMESGELREGDPRRAAMQLLAVLRGEHQLHFLEGVRSNPMTEEEIAREVDAALEVFLQAYEPTK